jgi:hypothetical protein
MGRTAAKTSDKTKSKTKTSNDDTDEPGPFHVEVVQEQDGTTKTLSTRYIVWAAGEFQYPRDKNVVTSENVRGWNKNPSNDKEPPKNKNKNDNDNDNDSNSITDKIRNLNTNKKETNKKETNHAKKDSGSVFHGAELCIHNSRVKSWAKLPGDDFVIIGGYESGIDAAVNLSRAGKNCTVLASTPCWNLRTGDPSSELAPYTSDRLRSVLAPGFSPKPTLMAPLRVIAVDRLPDGGGYGIAARWSGVDDNDPSTHPALATASGIYAQEPGEKDSIVVIRSEHPPILCTGFEGSVAARASHLFSFPAPNSSRPSSCVGDGPILTRNDESTRVPGVFLVGPTVSHGATLSFCFVYKFRQRFGVVANAICQGLGMDTADAVAECRKTNMYLDDFATCEDTCGDAC